METKALLSNGGLVFMAIYLCSLILIGFWGRLKRKKESLSDFYRAGLRRQRADNTGPPERHSREDSLYRVCNNIICNRRGGGNNVHS